mmetsp:Transcript_32518/g.76574  ORF Transcript_32518/g.76574 Transcript_32518/m.76574 type:complete len:677 (-) Transcript_32518:2529-4559(-)
MARTIRRRQQNEMDNDNYSYASDNSVDQASTTMAARTTLSVASNGTDSASTGSGDLPLDSAPRSLPISKTNIPRVACAILASITTGGTTYAFGLYGGALKKRLHLTQSQLDTISAVFFSAGLFSFIPGAMADRFGARNGICLGGITGAISLMLFWGVAKGHFSYFVPASTDENDPTLVITVLSVLNIGIFLSCALVTGSVFKVISCQCGPGSKGSAVGIAKGFVGLGSGAYACLFQSIRQPTMSDLDFLPLCAFFFVTAASIPSWFGLPNKANETFVPDVFTPLHFRVLYASLAALAVLVIGNALLGLYNDSHNDNENNKNHEESSPNFFMTGLVLFVWIAPIVSLLFLPQRSDWQSEPTTGSATVRRRQSSGSNGEYEQVTLLDEGHPVSVVGNSGDDSNNGEISLEPINREDLLADEESVEDEESTGSVARQHSEGVQDKNMFQMLQTPSAWMMLWIGTILTGSGTVETNNLGQMVESLGFNNVVTPATLAMFSVAQSAGRVITGAASEAALTFETRRCCIDKGVPRPFFFVLASFVSILAHTILAVATNQVSFVIGITLSGLAFGMGWPLMVLCVGEFFGTAHVGANYMFYDGFTSAAGTFLLSKVVAQQVYEEHIDHHHHDNGSGKDDGVTCYGIECFQTTHVVIVFLSATCVVVGLLMQYKTRGVYSRSNA